MLTKPNAYAIINNVAGEQNRKDRLNGVQEAVSSTLATRTKAISQLTGGFFVVTMRICGRFRYTGPPFLYV